MLKESEVFFVFLNELHRCIRVNRLHRQDPELLRASRESGVKYGDLGLPRELTLWVDPGEVCCRYGEQSPCFSVATFSGDEEDDKDVAKKVTSALERVTSDYHSGSSSDEDSTHTSPLTVPRPWAHQVVCDVIQCADVSMVLSSCCVCLLRRCCYFDS